MYLDLLKKTLTYALWPEPPHPVDVYKGADLTIREKALAALYKLLSSFNGDIEVVKKTSIYPEHRENGMFWPANADTMVGLKRLDNLQDCIETVLKEGIEGDLIETGVWRGGACILMRAVLAAHRVKDRRVFVADSFKGLPEPDPKQYPADKWSNLHSMRYLKVTKDEVMNNFKKYGLLDEQVIFLEGWFKDSLLGAPINKLAVLRLDGDMFGSTIEVLNILYPKLARGGFCIIDDYALEPCRKAVDDYRKEHGIASGLVPIDWTGKYWRKE